MPIACPAAGPAMSSGRRHRSSSETGGGGGGRGSGSSLGMAGTDPVGGEIVEEVAKVLVERNISAVVVVDDDRQVMGLVSEGDLMRRCETGTERKRSKWREIIAENDALAREYRLSHALKAHSIMSRHVVCVDEDTSLGRLADIFESKGIKRVPVTRQGRLVGIVSRRDLVKAFVAKAAPATPAKGEADDAQLRETLARSIRNQPWADTLYLQTLVSMTGWWISTASPAPRRGPFRSISCRE